MSNDFLIWKYRRVDGACALKDLRGFAKTFRLNDGMPLASEWPETVEYHMDPDTPDNLRLLDNVMNANMLIVASTRLRQFLQAQDLVEVEYLPIRIVDHKGRIASQDHCIVHPVGPVDAVDKARSQFKVDPFDADMFDSFTRLELDPSVIPAEKRLFRMRGFWDATFAHRELSAQISSQGFEGVRFLEIQAFPER